MSKIPRAHRTQVMLGDSELAEIEHYRRYFSPERTLSGAIRRLVKIGLMAAGSVEAPRHAGFEIISAEELERRIPLLAPDRGQG